MSGADQCRWEVPPHPPLNFSGPAARTNCGTSPGTRSWYQTVIDESVGPYSVAESKATSDVVHSDVGVKCLDQKKTHRIVRTCPGL